jgi:hypothetical protein
LGNLALSSGERFGSRPPRSQDFRRSPKVISQSQRAFDRRLHVHILEFGDRDIQMGPRLRPRGGRLVFHQELGKPEMRQSQLGTEADFAGGF